ncbi:hypothetical protein YYG_02559 [Plasmodium vinckei petteri]|uniref:PIR protein CIR protein n=1 Tax=Plasmodium vinckei petteri TaxID=138298 RepID=W7B245_PLAVN|nr:hypothetical protein YYG_02559 [Plasmodium vinckei petteri]
MFDSLYKKLSDDDDEAHRTNGKSLLYETYCPKNNGIYGKCNSDFDKINAELVYLLVQLFGNVDSEGEQEDQKDRYVYYGLLWISYKLKQLSNKQNDESIVNYEWYGEVEEYVQPKISLLNKDINIDNMNDLYYIFK